MQAAGDLGVGQPGRDLDEHFPLALGEQRRAPRPAARPGRGLRANSAIRRRVTLGVSRASPPAMTRMASSSCSGGVSLSKNPLAPDAQRLEDVLVLVEGRHDEDAGRRGRRRRRMSLVASSPSHARASGCPSARRPAAGRGPGAPPAMPSAASPTTCRSGAESTSTRNPARTRASSSAISTRIPSPGGPPGLVMAGLVIAGTAARDTTVGNTTVGDTAVRGTAPPDGQPRDHLEPVAGRRPPVSEPPSSAARSRMPVRPNPPAPSGPAAGARPAPSSVTLRMRWSGPCSTATRVPAPGRAS